MDSLVDRLIGVLQQTVTGDVIYAVLDQLGTKAANVQVVGVEDATIIAALAPAEGRARCVDVPSDETVHSVAQCAEHLIEADGRVALVTGLTRTDPLVAVAPQGALADFPSGYLVVSGDRVLEVFSGLPSVSHIAPVDRTTTEEVAGLAEDLASVDETFAGIEDLALDYEIDKLGHAVRQIVTNKAVADVLITLPLRLTRVLASVADGASVSLLQLLGPGSSLLLAEHQLIEVGTWPQRLTGFGRTVCDAARTVLSSIETADDREAVVRRAMRETMR